MDICFQNILRITLTACFLFNHLSEARSGGLHRDIRSSSKKTFSWLHPVKKEDSKVQNALNNPLREKLKIIGPFLAAHKYFAVDVRRVSKYSMKQKGKGGFYRHFPIPRLRSMHPRVRSACEQGVLQCIEEIYGKASKSKSVAKLHRNINFRDTSIPNYFPFRSEVELFRYRATASYYMCWYTDLKTSALSFIEEGYGCLYSLSDTLESKGNSINDFRAEYGGAKTLISIRTCAYLWFCPDPCYGKTTKGNVRNEHEALNDQKNPCKDLPDKSCSWVIGENSNFDNLMRNRFIITCNCESKQKGYVWSSRYGMCIDQDECYDRVAQCPDDKVCRNTIGSYECDCRRGFHLSEEDGVCRRSPLFKGSLDTVHLRRNAKETIPFWMKVIEKFLGIF